MGDVQQASQSSLPEAAARRGEAMRDATSRGHARAAHIRRCRAAGPPDEHDIQRMVDEYLSRGGRVSTCKPAYLMPVHGGTGRADIRS